MIIERCYESRIHSSTSLSSTATYGTVSDMWTKVHDRTQNATPCSGAVGRKRPIPICAWVHAPCGAFTPHRSAERATMSTCCHVQPCLPCTPSGPPSSAALRPLRRPRRRLRSRSWQGLFGRGQRCRREGRASQLRILRTGYRAGESMSSARIAGAKCDGARVRDEATYVKSR